MKSDCMREVRLNWTVDESLTSIEASGQQKNLIAELVNPQSSGYFGNKPPEPIAAIDEWDTSEQVKIRDWQLAFRRTTLLSSQSVSQRNNIPRNPTETRRRF